MPAPHLSLQEPNSQNVPKTCNLSSVGRVALETSWDFPLLSVLVVVVVDSCVGRTTTSEKLGQKNHRKIVCKPSRFTKDSLSVMPSGTKITTGKFFFFFWGGGL